MRFPLPSFPQTQIQNEQFNNEGKNKVSQKRTNEQAQVIERRKAAWDISMNG